MTQLHEMVVTKGRTVVHDGKTYGQHTRINLPPNEAIRLEVMGFVLAVSVVRGQLQDPDGGGPVSDGSAGDGSGAAGDGSASDGSGAAGDGTGAAAAGQKTSNAAAKNTEGRSAKKTGA